MVRAFIMVETEAGHAEEVAAAAGDTDYVTEAHVVAGQYDVIVEAEAEEVYDVMHSASTRIRGMEHVTDTKTYICLE